MGQKTYGKLEYAVIDLFSKGKTFNWNGVQYEVILSGKPKASIGRGEPKTDAFIRLISKDNSESHFDLKISCKLANKEEFQENKIKAERAKQIWGIEWQKIIKTAALANKNALQKTKVFFPFGQPRTKETLFTNGWKVEIASKQRELSYPLELSAKDIRDIIYKGLTLSERFKNSKIDGVKTPIPNSGIAEYMLVSTPDQIKSVSDVLNNMVLIDDYPIVPHYIIFTANNLRVLKNKSDGDRPLGVQVLWSADSLNNKMTYSIDFSHPLDPNYSGKAISERTMSAINKLGSAFKKDFI